MTSRLNPYLSFRGRAREALDLHAAVFGGTAVITTSGELGDPPRGAGDDGVRHGRLDTPTGLTLMCPDVPSTLGPTAGGDVTVSPSGDDADAQRGSWERVFEGGSITVPLERQAWGDGLGRCTDRFGVPWLVDVAAG